VTIARAKRCAPLIASVSRMKTTFSTEEHMCLQSDCAWRSRRALIVAASLATMVAASMAAAQESAQPIPKVSKEGPTLRFEFPAMRVGIGEYDEGPTGTTVFYFPDGVKGAVDVRGGSSGTLNATILMDSYESKMVQAVVFSGGSWYGLSAATGVANAIKELKAEEGNVDFVAGVVGAIIYDVGDRRYSRITPDDRLGKAALRSATAGSFPLGARGAGRFAMQGIYYMRSESGDIFSKNADPYTNWPHSGQGAAFRTIGPTKIGVFTVVNALGTIVDRNGRVVRCKRNSSATECSPITDRLKRFAPIGGSGDSKGGGPTGNTTLTLVVTNEKMPFWALKRLAVQVHGSMNRAIQPFATEEDGDVLYAVTTDEVENKLLSNIDLSVLASELAWDAILSSVPDLPAEPAPLGTKLRDDQLRRYAGTYEFYGGNELTIKLESGSLHAALKGDGRIYFDKNRTYRLTAAADGLFIIESPARDVVRFDESGGQITGLTLNPGPWAINAKVRR
jgi:6-aminohexanoate-oligomer endohydrolase